jgi:hypothetical protein
VDGAETAAGGSRVELALCVDVAPEDERVAAVLVRAWVEQVARHARGERQRPQVDEDVPGLAEHDGVVATKAVRLGDGDRCGHRRHGVS